MYVLHERPLIKTMCGMINWFFLAIYNQFTNITEFDLHKHNTKYNYCVYCRFFRYSVYSTQMFRLIDSFEIPGLLFGFVYNQRIFQFLNQSLSFVDYVDFRMVYFISNSVDFETILFSLCCCRYKTGFVSGQLEQPSYNP